MSGGSWNYFYNTLEDDIASRLIEDKNPIRRAFGKHLMLCAKALHDIEWVDSCDMSDGDEIKAIEEALGANAKQLHLEEIKKEAEETVKKLTAILERLEKKP